MKKFLLSFFLLITLAAQAQFRFKPLDTLDAALPGWAKMMYRPGANVYEVERAYEEYYRTHPFEQTPYTGYYQHWRRYMQEYVQEDGSIERTSIHETYTPRNTSSSASGPWRFAGPERNLRRRNGPSDPIIPISWHANVYCIDRSISNPDVLYAGTENGGAYRSADHGASWNYLSLNYDHVTVTAISVNPSNENEVIMCADERIFRTTDGGATWTRIQTGSFQSRNIAIWQFLYNPDNTLMVFAAAGDSLYRSTDGGINWRGVYKGECQSVAFNPLNSSIVYALRYDAQQKIPYFQKSLDSGLTFTPKPTGWFSVPPADAGLIESFGGRIAVTVADTSRIYVLLVGSSQSSATLQLNGQIGVYRSDDGGESWSLPHGSIGAPYNATSHPNMMTFSGGNDTYNQIYYNTTIIASQLNANRILVGGMSLWRSNDGAASFGAVGGYIGSVKYVHPDNQELKVYKTSPSTEEVWLSSDGGINLSNTFMQSHVSLTNGIYGAAFWGFDQGWNDDIMVGGRYHNGNAARRDGYPDGDYLQLGGGEAATGYVNYSNEKKTYFSDIDGVILPDSITGYATSFGMDTDPNESYVDNSSSRILFDWDYWNVGYTGKDNAILKSTTGGSTFSTLYTFGTNTNDKIYWIEQSRVNTNILFAQQVVNSRSVLWRSVDRGASWTQVTQPQSKRDLVFSLSGTSANELWIAYPGGSNGAKIYKSVNSGASWTNLTTGTLNGLSIKSIAHQFGTRGGVYAATYHGPVYYRNDSMPDWSVVGSDLPAASYPLRAVPFYRDQKLRLATWQLGVWETELYESSSVIADFSADFKNFYCPGDTVRFVPHSVASDAAVYTWSFPGAVPSTYTGMYPLVVYQQTGSFDVQLIVTDHGVSDTIVKYGFIETVPAASGVLAEDFQSNFSANWRLKGMPTGTTNWVITNTAGGFGASTRSLLYDNYNIDAAGNRDQLWAPKCDLTSFASGWLKFDVAYADYSSAYSDSLEVDVSTDCGLTFTPIYRKGGQALATAPTLTTAIFVPAANEWRTDSIDISNWAGNAAVIFDFVSIGHFGQALYIDNIQLSATTSTEVSMPDNAEVQIYPNPFRASLTVETDSRERFRMDLFDDLSRLVKSVGFIQRINLETASLAPGFYSYRISDDKGHSRTGKLIKSGE